MQGDVERLLGARTAFAQVASPNTVGHDVIVQLGVVGNARNGMFVEGLESWTWHATFEALYRRADTSVSELTVSQHCCHKDGIVQTISGEGCDRWFRGGAIDGFVCVHPLPGGALPNLAARLLLRRETDFPKSNWRRLEETWPKEHPFLGLETRNSRSVRVPGLSASWRIDFVQVCTDWPIRQTKAPSERHEITIVWDPFLLAAAAAPFTQLEGLLRVLQTVVGETEADLNKIIGQHIDMFEQTQSFA